MLNKIKEIFWKRKNIVIIFYLTLIMILIYLIYLNFDKQKRFQDVENSNKKIVKYNSLKKLEKKDTDGDGLEDWQEYLYGTDIELTDTDGDGISDFDEVEKNQNPLAYGKGDKESIEKIKDLSVGVVGIAEQRDRLKKYKEKMAQEESVRFDLFLKKNKKTLTLEQKKNLNKQIKEKVDIRKDLNTLGKIISQYDSNIDISRTNDFNIFFSIVSGKEKKVKLTDDQIKYLKNVANINKVVASNLDKMKMKNKDIFDFKKQLSFGYHGVGNNLLSLISKYNNNDLNTEEEIKSYGNSISNIINTMQYIHIFLDSRDISFGSYEKGSMFSYSM